MTVAPFAMVMLPTPPPQVRTGGPGDRVPVHVPMSATASVGVEVGMLKPIPVALFPPGTLIALGADPDGLTVTVSVAGVPPTVLVAVMVTGLFPVGRAVGAL